MINKGVSNHPYKCFARESFKEAAAHKGIHGATSAWFWRGAKGARWWCFDDETTKLVYRVIFFELQSQCLTDSVAQEFSISRDSSWKIMVVSWSWSRTTQCELGRKGSNSIVDDEIWSCISSSRFCLGQGYAVGFSKQGEAEVFSPSFSWRLPRGEW